MEDVNISKARERWTGWWKGESYPTAVVQGRCIEDCGAVPMSMEKIKSDEETKKKQRKGLNSSAIKGKK
jgi:hypothetical protein